MSFSVVVPSKSAANLVPCVRAIREAGETCRIIVVDDGVDWFKTGTEDGGRAVPLQIMPGVKPFVFSRNVNIGIRAAGDDDVILLNDDALLKTPMGFTHLESVATSPAFGCVGAVTNLTGQPLQQPRPGLARREVPHIAFVCVYIPRRTINLIGMLDERYNQGYGCEDRDYCEAITRAGLKVGVFDGCYVDHGSLTSSFRGDPKAGGDFSRNYAILKEKWGII